ncbi:MAG: hypothetical protein JO337_09505 [Acidimicrobiales bacterium]|nr:hypothetical protein [Acidimicrobiales bacterium]
MSSTYDGCNKGDAFVQGTLNGGLTIASSNDTFITGDITYSSFTGTNVLGLIANNFVEINHPIDSSGNTIVGTVPFYNGTTFNAPADYNSTNMANGICSGGITSRNSTNPPQCTVTLDAAVLTVKHSMATANFTQGGVLGNLKVDGAIAGTFMDIEGVFGGSGSLVDGFNELYTYDQRLQWLSPPYFLDPSQTTWHSISYVECHKSC